MKERKDVETGESGFSLPFSLRLGTGCISFEGSELLDMFSEALVLWEKETGRVLFMNEAARVLYGCADDLPLFVSEVYPEWKERPDSSYSVSTANHRRKDGSVVPVRMTCRIFPSPAGEIVMMVAADISPQSAAQESVVLASAIQREFLPGDLTEGSILEIRNIYRPLFLISGDMFGYSWEKKGEVLSGFIVDVMGHGVPAALQTSVLMILFRQAFEERPAGEPLCEKLFWVNRMAMNRILSDSFAAALCFRAELSRKRIEWCSAGIPAFLAGNRRGIEKKEVSGSLLGLSGPADYGEGSMEIKPGDYFFFLSDGFLERPGMMPREGMTFSACYDHLFSLAYSGVPRDDQTALGLHFL